MGSVINIIKIREYPVDNSTNEYRYAGEEGGGIAKSMAGLASQRFKFLALYPIPLSYTLPTLDSCCHDSSGYILFSDIFLGFCYSEQLLLQHW